jgi:NADH dehydrogenase
VSRGGGARCPEGMIAPNAHSKVVVIGGGYAGTLAANHLRLRPDIDITLVNPRPRFVERVRLHQHVAGTADATVDYESLLGEGVHLVVDNATRIDTAARTVELESGRALDYDYVIYAVGSTGASPEFALPIAEYESAQRLRTELAALSKDAPVTVVGGGLSGVETAAELAEQGRKVTLVCGGALVPTFSKSGRRSITRWLARHDVLLRDPRPGQVARDDGSASDRPVGAGVRVAAEVGDQPVARLAGAHRYSFAEPAVRAVLTRDEQRADHQ